MAGTWFDPVPQRGRVAAPERPPAAPLEEPTQKLPVIAPRVGARTVIVYERRSWGLLVLTGLLVALTAGVILGQTIAFQPHGRTGSGVAVADEITPSVSPSASPSAGTGTGASAARISAPLGRTTASTFEVSGAASSISVVAADLGDRLYDIAGTDDSAVPAITTTRSGPVLTFIRTGAPGRSGAIVQLSDKVRWTLRFTGSTAEQSVDLRTGKLAALDLAGGTGRAVLQLPVPKGTVPIRVTGDTGSLDLLTRDGVPVRLKLGSGAASAVVDARTRTNLKATTLTPSGWSTTANRYDLTAKTKIAAVRVTHD